MALAEYELNGFTYLFDVNHVPHGATLVTDDVAVGPVVLFPDQVTPAADADADAADADADADADTPKTEPADKPNKARKAPADKAE